MAVAQSAIKSQINIKLVSDSVTSLSKGIDKAQKSASGIGEIILKRNKFKREAISQDKLSFFKRREAVRRKEQEGIIEAGQLGGAEKRTSMPLGAAITESTKGFLGRMMDFVGTIFVGWLLKYLPSIILTAKNLIQRIQTITGILGKFVVDIKDILFGFGNALGAISSNILTFNFSDDDRKVSTAFDELNSAINDLGTHFDEAVKLLTTPLGQGPGEEETYTPPEQPQEQPSEEVPSQTNLPALPPTNTYPNQYYGAPRPGRKHAGVDFDISGPNAKFYSRIGGVVVGSPFRFGADGWAIDIYNKELGVYERIAEAAKILVKPGQTVKPGDAVVQGESGTGVIHYEIRKKIEGGYENTVDPIAFLNKQKPKPASTASAGTGTQPSTPARSTPSGGTLSIEQLVAIAKQAGFNEKNAVIAAAVAKAESGGRSGVVNDNPGTGDLSYGLWQINMIGRLGPARLKQFGISSNDQLKDPLTNAKAAFMLSGGSNFSPWSVYKSGKYRQYLPEAQKVAGTAPSSLQSTSQLAQVSQPPSNLSSEVQSITPERTGTNVVVTPQQMGQPQGPISTPAPGAPRFSGSDSRPEMLLNRFMVTRLLLDLAYT